MSETPRMDPHDDPNVIRKQIEETRERIAGTAEALAYKTDVPARLKENVAERVGSVKGALGDVAANVAHGLSDAGQTASAVAADASSKLSQGVHDVSKSAKSNFDDTASSLDDTTSNVKSKVADATDNVKGRVADATGNVKGKLVDATGNVKGSLADASANVRANVSGIGDAAQEKIANSGQATKSLALNTKGFLEKNPLGLAIGSIAAGFLLGLALPVTDLERDNVGPLSEKVKDQAKSAASDMVAQGKAVVATAVTDALSSTSK